ncbi:MAG: cbb3-type cytochrome c oxidase N-terminal domain-containing protein [Saprospiraceae bacterium]
MKDLSLLLLDAAGTEPVLRLSGLTAIEQIVLLILVLFIIGACWTLLSLSFTMMRVQKLRLLEQYHPELLKKAGIQLPSEAGGAPWWKIVLEKLTDRVPVERESAIQLAHEYDGIYELDNNLPPWWKALFVVTVIVAPIYIYFVHFTEVIPNQRERYALEMEQAEQDVKAYLATQADQIDETTVSLLTDADALTKGQYLFESKCSPCHGKLGEGSIGPNLTDDYWLHGGSIKDIFITIKYGVPEKGMIPWKTEMRPSDMQQVASFIRSLRGTDPPSPKEPQGELYVIEDETPPAAELEPALPDESK